jgi:hypothetical protein
MGGPAYPVFAERYRDGKRYAVFSWWMNEEGYTEQLMDDLFSLVGSREFKVFTRTMTKSAFLETELVSLEVFYDEKGGIIFKKVSTNTDSNTGNSTGNTGNSTSNTGNDNYIPGYYAAVAAIDAYNGTINAKNTQDIITSLATDGINSPIYASVNAGSSSGNNSYNATPAVPPSNATKTTIPSSPTPRNYVPTTGDVLTNNLPLRGEDQIQKDLISCMPISMSYINNLFGGNRATVQFMVDLKLSYGFNALTAALPQNILEDYLPKRFTIDESLSSSYKGLFEAEGRKVVMVPIPLPPEALRDFVSVCPVGSVLQSDGSIQIPNGEGGFLNLTPIHSIVVVGCKANGDVIYMDPMILEYQEVNPDYLFDHIAKYVITGINQ